MSTNEFKTVISKISPFTDYIYFHLLGEPLMHPSLKEFLCICEEYNLKVIITTNATLIKEKSDILINSKSHYKTVLSLHSFEANQNVDFLNYIKNCLDYTKKAHKDKTVVLRLWNNGGKAALNDKILKKIEEAFPAPWDDTRGGKRVSDNVYLQFGDKFDWPDINSKDTNDAAFCYGLRDQIGILADGTVVPCCLDNNGQIKLGNIFESNFEDIIKSQKAQNIYNGFSQRCAVEELCKKCSFARKF